MELKIGQVFEYNDEWYQCVESHGDICDGCAGYWSDYVCNSLSLGNCEGKIFKKLEKVGEPYGFQGRTFQTYKLYMIPFLSKGSELVAISSKDNNTIEIEIKQNKDMEEKKIQLRKEDIDWLKSEIRWSVLPGYSITYEEDYDRIVEEMMKLFTSFNTKQSNSEKIGKNLRPFDLQKAREGKPVCTRNGRKARIICFDKGGEQPIVALIEKNEEESIDTFFSNGHSISKTNEVAGDLMMLPEKKEGWVNIYKSDNDKFSAILGSAYVYNTKEEAIDNADPDTTIATVKISW